MSEAVAANPMQVAKPVPDGRCTATARGRHQGRCKQPAVPGATVCRFHGGAAPQVIAAARLRCLMAADAVMAKLIKAVDEKDAPLSARVQAMNSLLGLAPKPERGGE